MHINVLLDAGLVTAHSAKRGGAGHPRSLYRTDERSDHWLVPLDFERPREEDALARSRAFMALMSRPRSVRQFGPDPVPRELVENAIRTARTALGREQTAVALRRRGRSRDEG